MVVQSNDLAQGSVVLQFTWLWHIRAGKNVSSMLGQNIRYLKYVYDTNLQFGSCSPFHCKNNRVLRSNADNSGALHALATKQSANR